MPIKHHTLAVTPAKIPWNSYNEDHDYSNLDASKLQGSTKAQIIEEAQEGMGSGEPSTAINKPAAQFSRGMIIFWSGKLSEIPFGWHLCDGKDGTPDLSDRFIMGTTSENDIGETGGKTTLAHKGMEVEVEDHESHIHLKGTLSVGDHSGQVTGQADAGSTQRGSTNSTLTLKAHTHSIPTLTHSLNGSTDVESLTLQHSVDFTPPQTHVGAVPPYYKLAFIMFIGGENLADCVLRIKCSLPTDTVVSLNDDTVDREVYSEEGDGDDSFQTVVVQKGSVLVLSFSNSSGGPKDLVYEYRSAEDGRVHGNGTATVIDGNSRSFWFVADHSGDITCREDGPM